MTPNQIYFPSRRCLRFVIAKVTVPRPASTAPSLSLSLSDFQSSSHVSTLSENLKILRFLISRVSLTFRVSHKFQLLSLSGVVELRRFGIEAVSIGLGELGQETARIGEKKARLLTALEFDRLDGLTCFENISFSRGGTEPTEQKSSI